MKPIRHAGLGIGALGIALLLLGACRKAPEDEAKAAGLQTSDFPQVTADVFAKMDGGIVLQPNEVMGRNAWNLWSGGNQHFWNGVAQDSYGMLDVLKTLDNRKYKREDRFAKLGLINQPGFRPATKPDAYGLWIDEAVEPEPAGIDEKVYGKPSGILGFRLFPNPEFNEAARRKWDGDRYLNDPTYYNNNALVRPYRVGVSCGACHIAPLPTNPPADPANPGWENLASAIGNQYLNEGAVFGPNVEKGGFFFEELLNQPRGTSDTSRIATDHLNNPNAINAIFLLAERERIQATEKLTAGTLALPGTEPQMPVAHILKDGADSIGVPGATIRVYVNIGMFSEYWLTRHNRLIGLFPQKPFEIPYAREHSVFWRATEERLGNIAAFFRRLQPYHLADATGGAELVSKDETLMARGRQTFALNCASCHSSKQPPPEVDPHSGAGQQWFLAEVAKPEFLQDNFLSSERRIPVSEVKTNSARAFGTNAKAGHIWDNFSSQTYKDLPPPPTMEFYNPFNEAQPIQFNPAEKNVGAGYYRVPSLVSVWSSAPLLHNNMLGVFNGDPSVPGRLAAFQDGIEKLLWPERRLGKASIWRTENECYLHLRKEFVPKTLRGLAEPDGYLKIGPVPKGMPVNLLANLEPDLGDMVKIKAKLAKAFLTIKTRELSGDAATAELAKAVPELLAANKCPDFVEDKGHYYGTQLPDDDKRALIEYLKTF